MNLGLEINIEEIDKIIILRLVGRLDASSSSLLQKKLDILLKEKHKTVLLDFLNIDYLSSAGLRVLLAFTKKFEEKAGSLSLFSVTEDVYEIIRLTGFDKILNIYKDEKKALIEKSEHN